MQSDNDKIDSKPSETPTADPSLVEEVKICIKPTQKASTKKTDNKPTTTRTVEEKPKERLTINELKTLADTGNAAAQFELARRYDEGDGVRKNLKEMFKYYSLSAEQGHEKAITRVGIAHATGRGLTEKPWCMERNLEAAKRLAITVQKGDQDAQFWLAKILLNWSYSDEHEKYYLSALKDKTISKQEKKEYEESLSETTSMRAVLANVGLNIKSMDTYARKTMRTLVDANYMPALKFIADGNEYKVFDGTLAGSKRIACLNALANNGNHKYGTELAECYYHGYHGAEKDHQKARELVEKHAKVDWDTFVKNNGSDQAPPAMPAVTI